MGDDSLIENASKLMLEAVRGSEKEPLSAFVKPATEGAEDRLLFIGKKSGTLHDWISHVNSCLNTVARRLEGLCLLRAIVKQCSSETFTQCCATWIRLLIDIFQPHQSQNILEVTSAVLVEILKDAAQIPEVSRALATNHIPGFLGILMDAEKESATCRLRLLAVCMRHFPGPCGTIGYKLEACITSLLDCDQPDTVKCAQMCYPLLAILGGGGSGGIKHTEAWGQYAKKILCTLNSHLDLLYVDFKSESEQITQYADEQVALPNPSVEEPIRTFTLTNQVQTLCCCLRNMIREEFPARVKIPDQDILRFICNALEVTNKTLGDHLTAENSMLAMVIPKIHSAAIELLTALIESCTVSHHASTINQLYLQTLGWTQESSVGQIKPFSNLRTVTYQSIVAWLKTTGTLSDLASQSGEKLIHQCIKDASPQTETTRLASGIQMKGETKKGSKTKVKGQQQPVLGSELSGSQRVNVLATQGTCLHALEVLRHLILTSGVKLKPNLHNEIHNFAIPLLNKIQTSTASDMPQPYSCSRCRKQLYKVLLASVLVQHPQASSPDKCALSIFSRGKQDRNLQVSSACTEASIICAQLIHPRRPSLPRSQQPRDPYTIRSSSVVPETSGKADASAEEMDMKDPSSGIYSPSAPSTGMGYGSITHSTLTSPLEGASPDAEDSKSFGTVSSPQSVTTDGAISVVSETTSGSHDAGKKPSAGGDAGISQKMKVATVEEKDAPEEKGEKGEGKPEEKKEEEKEEMKMKMEDSELTQKHQMTDKSKTRKRKQSGGEKPSKAKKKLSEETEAMLATFVDVHPDSD